MLHWGYSFKWNAQLTWLILSSSAAPSSDAWLLQSPVCSRVDFRAEETDNLLQADLSNRHGVAWFFLLVILLVGFHIVWWSSYPLQADSQRSRNMLWIALCTYMDLCIRKQLSSGLEFRDLLLDWLPPRSIGPSVWSYLLIAEGYII